MAYDICRETTTLLEDLSSRVAVFDFFDHSIGIVPYSPLGREFFSAGAKLIEILPDGDFCKMHWFVGVKLRRVEVLKRRRGRILSNIFIHVFQYLVFEAMLILVKDYTSYVPFHLANNA
uniref:Uncharacterized protein n=1 Tax=Solanum demissum TaxID=50514 RepID=A0A191UMS5_SOLDE|nr:hypothetical protein [Solanum demissum]